MDSLGSTARAVGMEMFSFYSINLAEYLAFGSLCGMHITKMDFSDITKVM